MIVCVCVCAAASCDGCRRGDSDSLSGDDGAADDPSEDRRGTQQGLSHPGNASVEGVACTPWLEEDA